MLFCEEMRPSTVWFLIACLWLVDVFIGIVRGHAHQVWPQAVVAAAFLLLWMMHRRRERPVRRPQVRDPLK